MKWWGEMDSNHRRAEPDRFTVCRLKTATNSNEIGYEKIKSAGTGLRTVSPANQHFPDTNHLSPELFADLAEIVALWPQLPDHVRIGIFAMVKAAVGKA